MTFFKEHALQELRDVTGRKVGEENNFFKPSGIKHGRGGLLTLNAKKWVRKTIWYNPGLKHGRGGFLVRPHLVLARASSWSSSVVEGVVEDGIGARVVVVLSSWFRKCR